ncbi:hypothetical protein [Blastopirellula retiformator]|uniref:Zinc-ribbon domain-containing protein n=1 Tax=Blastopirellula retiformator TaxID=2527970 RepID=A0A5C5V480_9BACT|nr:hypothetical protein [Blastopirellula retiformator]TWT33354.1 hypothetical protein Enr8_31810 [Blastopirellula retiformator]
MATICSNCGEELIGAVNRCWRCGREFEVDALADMPPVRRSPVLREYLRENSASPADGEPIVATTTPEEAEGEIVTAEIAEKPPAPLKLDSPFQATKESATDARPIPWTGIGLCLGGLGAMLCLVTIFGVPFAIAGIGLLIWRAGSIPGRHVWLLLLLIILLLLVGSFRTSIALHDHFFGRPLFPSFVP